MRRTLSVRIVLLSLTVLMLLSASEVDAYRHLPCCYGGYYGTKEPISKCFTQTPRDGCSIHAYLLKTSAGQWQCITSKSTKFKDMVNSGKIKCPPAIESELQKI